MIMFYHFLVCTGFLLTLPVLPVVWLVSEKRRANLLQRMGIHTGLKKKTGSRKRIWIHALSVGEVRSALPLVKGIARRYPKIEIIFTTSTRTGFDTARAIYFQEGFPLVSQIAYFPFDLPWAVGRVRRRIDPDWVCLVETDLWPGFLDTMSHHHIPVVLMNARMSDRSMRRYRWIGPLTSLFFSKLTHVLVQTRQDLDRFHFLGVPETRLTLAGNIKFDQPLTRVDKKQAAGLRDWFGICGEDRLWLAGSTHPGEETILLSVFLQVRKAIPGLKLIIAPRDPGRRRQVARELAGRGWPPVLLSQTRKQPENSPVMLLDCLGILSSAYAVCDVAFIGGSLVSCGGHNPLEPAMFRKPVLFGPHMEDFSQVTDLMLAGNAACRVTDAAHLAKTLETLLSRPDQAAEMGGRAFSVFQQNTGAVALSLKYLARLGLGNSDV